MTQDQVMGLIRQLLPLLAGLAIALGYKPKDVAHWSDLTLQIAGPALMLGGIVWTIVSNTKASIIASTIAMPEVKAIITETNAAGRDMANSSPSTAVVPAGTVQAADLASNVPSPKDTGL